MNWQQYFFFIGTTLLVPLWLYLFSKKEKRSDMLLIGIMSGIVATVVEQLYARFDYWTPVYLFPQFPFEDFYYGFILGGIGAVLYEVILHKQKSNQPAYHTHKRLTMLFFLVTGVSFWLLVNILKLNSIVAHIVPTLAMGIAVVIIRRDLFLYAVGSGLFLTIVTMIMFWVLLLLSPELFQNYWHLDNLSRIFLIGIPLEELLFAFSIGFFTGTAHEFIFGYALNSQNQ